MLSSEKNTRLFVSGYSFRWHQKTILLACEKDHYDTTHDEKFSVLRVFAERMLAAASEKKRYVLFNRIFLDYRELLMYS